MAKIAKIAFSEDAWAVMVAGFQQSWPAERIAQAVLDECQETVSARTVARRAAEWRADRDQFREAKRQMDALVAAMKDGGALAEEQLLALAQTALLRNPEALTSADPIKLQGKALEARKVQLLERRVAVQERAVAIDEAKMRLLEERESRVKATVEDKGGTMTAEEKLAEIQGIYGIRK